MCYKKILQHRSLYDFYIWAYYLHLILLPFCMFGFINIISQIDIHWDPANLNITNMKTICNKYQNSSLTYQYYLDINISTIITIFFSSCWNRRLEPSLFYKK